MQTRTAAWQAVSTNVTSGARPTISLAEADTSQTFASWAVLAFLTAHIPLALLMSRVGGALSTAHAATIFALGVWSVLNERTDRVVLAVGYIAGAEVLWRMTGAAVPWEFGKYGASALMLLDIVRRGRTHAPVLAMLYFALLLPSSVISWAAEPWVTVQNQLSFNLSGPFSLMIAAWFFSGVQLSVKALRSIFIAVIGPVIGVLAISALGVLTAQNIQFTQQSSKVASGGYGPNQVSALLGFGALLALLVGTDGAADRRVRLLMGGLVMAFAAQSALTFSRGGLYAAAGSAAVAAALASADSRTRGKLIPVVVGLLVFGYIALPYLDRFTGGELVARFEDTNPTGRGLMVGKEIQLWKEYPLLGVGPGGARVERLETYFEVGGPKVRGVRRGGEYAAHTEFSRLLAEHGTFGLVALMLLVAAGLANVRRAPDPITKALIASLLAWSALYTSSAAMRTFLPSLAVGLGFARFLAAGSVSAEATDPHGSAGLIAPFRRLTVGHRMLGNPRERATGR